MQEVHGAEKIISVGIVGIEMQGSAQETSRLRVLFLFERYSSKFQGEPLVARLQPRSCRERLARIFPAPQLR